MLTISGERKQQQRQTNENEIRIERFYGTFSRSFVLPDNVDTDKIRAESQDGVLVVHIPKTEQSKAKSISIEVQ